MAFYALRLGRVFPLYWLVVIPVLLARGETNGWVASLSLFNEFAGPSPTAPLLQTWTLPVELCFYFLAPLLVAISARWSAVRLVVAVYALTLVGVAVYSGTRGLPFFEALKFVARFSFPGRIVEFVIGMQLARTGVIEKLAFKGSTTLGAAGIAGTVGLLAKWDWLNVRGFDGVFLNNLVLPFFVAILISSLVAKPRTWLARGLGSGPMVVLGKSSYAFYLIHLGIFSTALQMAIETWPAKTPLLFVMLNLAAVALWWGFERPIYRAVKQGIDELSNLRKPREVRT